MYPKPFLKWVGGKTQIIEQVIKRFPSTIDNYYEPFLGGGSVLLAFLHRVQLGEITISGKIVASDINYALIQLYKSIQTNPNELFTAVMKHREVYHSLDGNIVNRKPENIDEATTSKESYYYWIRKSYNNAIKNNKYSIETSAMFLFINKTCFRGMYREGPNGFNIPYGNYKRTPAIASLDELMRIHELIKEVDFICCSFEQILEKCHEGDFVYLDPPYVPENSKSFVGYTKHGFNIHERLFSSIKELNNKNGWFMMSNSAVPIVITSFDDCDKYNITYILARRAINSKNPASKTNEVLIQNYGI